MSSGLYTQPQFPPSPPQAPPPGLPQYAAPPRRSGGGNLVLSLVMIGGGVLILFSVLAVAGIWYAVSGLKGWVADLGREGIVAMVQQSGIPAGEKTEVIEQIDRVVAAYKAADISDDELEELLIKLDDSPAMAYICFYGMEEEYLEHSSLAPAEQEALRLALRRVLFGLTDEQISLEQFEATVPADFGYDLAGFSEEQVNEMSRQWLRDLTKVCDEAGVPANPPEVDVGDEVKKLVDGLLAK